MSDIMENVNELIKGVINSFGEIVRHFLPGIFIIGIAALSHPSWFDKVDLLKSKWLIVIGIIAIVIGNVWFVLHRYTIQQVLDLLFHDKYLPLEKKKGLNYLQAIAEHTYNYHNPENFKVNPGMIRHIRFRSSCMILMFITSEAMIIFAGISSTGTLLNHYCWWVIPIGVLVFIFAVWQDIIIMEMENKVIFPQGYPPTNNSKESKK